MTAGNRRQLRVTAQLLHGRRVVVAYHSIVGRSQVEHAATAAAQGFSRVDRGDRTGPRRQGARGHPLPKLRLRTPQQGVGRRAEPERQATQEPDATDDSRAQQESQTR